MCAYNVRIRAFYGCCGSLFAREPMKGVNALYLRVSGVFLLCCWRAFRGVTFLLYYFLLYTRVSMCASVYVASVLRVPILCRVRLRSSVV